MTAPEPTPTERVLVAARELLTPEGAWTQDSYARNDAGSGCGLRSNLAACWCATGAVYRAANTGPLKDNHPAVVALARTIQEEDELVGDEDVVVRWNDDKSRTHAEVLAAFDRAIATERARRAEGSGS